MTFLLDLRLESDSAFILNLDLCHVRLHNNAAFPWTLLIPQRPNITEIIDLTPNDQHLLMSEIALVSQVMKNLFQPYKLNVANLGNIVPQLHIHIIARFENDKAWPNPIWNSGVNEVDDSKEQKERLSLLKDNLLQQWSKKNDQSSY